jgi:hypothetical protein
MTWRTAQTGWSRLALRSSGSRRQYTLASYEQFAIGYLAVVRKEEGALIGRCGLMDLVVESAAHPSAEGPLAARRRTVGREPPARWKWSVARGIVTCGRSPQAARLSSSGIDDLGMAERLVCR